MSSPLGFAARLLGRMFGSAPCALVACGAGVMAPTAIVVQEASAQEWQFAGWSDSSSSFGFGFMGGSTPAPITARDLRMYAQVLGLDEMQMEIMQDAFIDFDRAYTRESVLLYEARSDAQHAHNDSGGWEKVQERLRDLSNAFDEKVQRMEEQFIGDLRLVLDARQLEKWSLLEREQRRVKTLAKYASYPEERIDLVACVQALELSEQLKRELEPVLEEYRDRMDSVLVSRNRRADQVGKQAAEANSQQIDWSNINYEDPMAVEAAYEQHNQRRARLVPLGLELRQACARVREVNLQFRTRIEEMLPPDQLEEFRKVAKPKSDGGMFDFSNYSRARMMISMLENLEMMVSAVQMQTEMWGESDSEEMAIYLRRMREVQPLTESQREQIAQIKADWEAGSDSIKRRHASQGSRSSQSDGDTNYIQLHTPQGTLSLMRHTDDGSSISYSGGWRGQQGEVNEDQQREQAELDQRIVDRLRAILTIEQRALMSMM